MSLRIRRGTAAELTTIAPEEGELIYTTDTKKLYVGDGATFGGIITSGSGSVLLNGPKSVSLASTGVLTVTGSIVPDTNVTYDLGSATNRFRDIYLSSSTINLGGNALSVDSSGLLAVSETVGGEGVGGIASVQWAIGNVLKSRTDSTSEFIAKYESLKVGDKITLLTGQSGAFTNTVLTVSGQVQKSAVVGGSYFDFVIPVNSSPVANVFVYRFTLTRVTGAPTDSINLGRNTVSVNSSGLLAMTESYIVAPPNVPAVSISAYWTTNLLVFLVAIANADKFDSLKVGDKITLLTGEMPANTVLTVTGPATSPKTVTQSSYYVYSIPVNLSPSTIRPSVDSFSITRTTGGTVSSLVNGTKSVSLASTGVLTVTGSIVPDTNVTYDLGSATNRFRDIYLSTSTINLGTNSVSVGSSGQLLVNGNNAATELVYFGGEGSGPTNASAIAWGTQDQVTWGQRYILVYGPGELLKRALFELKIGDKIKMGQGPDGGRPTLGEITVTVTGLPTTTYASNGYPQIVIQVDSAPVATTANFVYALYLPVRETSATIANGTKNLTMLPSGYVVFPTVTVPAHSYGVAGDVAGMVAFDSTYIYYCTANYVNNSTNIWKRTAHGTGTW
jgi:hypothetical protein